jgi:hypothetical protein
MWVQCLQRPEEGPDSTKAGVTDGYELLGEGAGNQTWVLHKSCMSFNLPSHLSTPKVFVFCFCFFCFCCLAVWLVGWLASWLFLIMYKTFTLKKSRFLGNFSAYNFYAIVSTKGAGDDTHGYNLLLVYNASQNG